MPKHDETGGASDDWAPGDLALCVRGGPLPCNTSPEEIPEWPKSGAVYHVESVDVIDLDYEPQLALFFTDAPMNVDDRVWGALRLKKIKPPSKDETIEAYKEIVSDSFVKVKVPNRKEKVKS